MVSGDNLWNLGDRIGHPILQRLRGTTSINRWSRNWPTRLRSYNIRAPAMLRIFMNPYDYNEKLHSLGITNRHSSQTRRVTTLDKELLCTGDTYVAGAEIEILRPECEIFRSWVVAHKVCYLSTSSNNSRFPRIIQAIIWSRLSTRCVTRLSRDQKLVGDQERWGHQRSLRSLRGTRVCVFWSQLQSDLILSYQLHPTQLLYVKRKKKPFEPLADIEDDNTLLLARTRRRPERI